MSKGMIKTTIREIKGSFGRYLAIFAIVMLGVALFMGLKATTPAMIETENDYLAKQNFYDFRLLSEIGFDSADVAKLAQMEQSAAVEGAVSVDAVCTFGDGNEPVYKFHTVPEKINEVILTAGRMPQSADECVLDSALYGEDMIGSEITVTDNNDPNTLEMFGERTFTAVGIVRSPYYINFERGTTSIGEGKITAFLYVPREAFACEYLTEIYVKTKQKFDVYTDAYEDYIDGMMDDMEKQTETLALARYDRIRGDAQAEIDDAQAELDTQVADAQKELADARKKISDGEQEIADGEKELRDGRRKAADGEQEIERNESKLADSEQEIAQGEQEIREKEQEIRDAQHKIQQSEQEIAENEQKLADGRAQLNQGKQQLQQQEAALKKQEAALPGQEAKLNRQQSKLVKQETKLAEQEAELTKQETELAGQEKELSAKEAELTGQELELKNKEAELTAQEAELKTKRQELDEEEAKLDTQEEQANSSREQLEQAYAAQQISQEQYTGQLQAILAGLQQIQDGREQLLAGKDQVQDSLAQVQDGLAQVRAGLAQVRDGLSQVRAALAKVRDGLAQVRDGLAQVRDGLAQVRDGLAQIRAGQQQIQAGRKKIQAADTKLAAAKKELAANEKKLLESESQLTAGKEEIAKARKELENGRQQLAQGKAKLQSARDELADGAAQLAQAKTELADAKAKLVEGRKDLEEGKAELADARKEYREAKAEFDQETADAQEKIGDARAELADLERPDSFVLTRNTNIGYACYESDSNIVAGIANVFPVFFFLVAALICMTTMNRMVEEQRTQIGVLKALGYGNGAIMGKYLFYAGSAAAAGAVAGCAMGTWLFPKVIWMGYSIMYSMGGITYYFDVPMAVLSMLAALLCSMGAAYASCRYELYSVPANLIRPKAPKSGKRIFLERVGFIWGRMKFLHKVSMRNIVRYKKRFFMMILGISGCTALLVTGFGIKDSVTNVADMQYDEIQIYDIGITFSDGIQTEDLRKLQEETGGMLDQAACRYEESADLDFGGKTKSVYLAIPQDPQRIHTFLKLHTKTGEEIPYPLEGETVLTEKVADTLGIRAGDSVVLWDSDRNSITVKVAALCENFVYNYAYISKETYQAQVGTEPAYKSAYATVKEGVDIHEAAAAVADRKEVLAVSVTWDMRERIASMMESMDYIVLLIIVCAGSLAFIVLYNLTNINITERIREIATIKVLGFYARETADYVFRENLALTGLGALAGLGLGKWLHWFVMDQVKIDMLSFKTMITPGSYVVSLVFTFGFAMLVNGLMYVKLEKINMAEALKSIE